MKWEIVLTIAVMTFLGGLVLGSLSVSCPVCPEGPLPLACPPVKTIYELPCTAMDENGHVYVVPCTVRQPFTNTPNFEALQFNDGDCIHLERTCDGGVCVDICRVRFIDSGVPF